MQVVPIPALRGAILDRNGQPLAQSVEAYDIVVDQQLIADEGNVAAYALQLEPLLNQDARDIQDKLTGDRRYRVLARKVTPETWRAISDLGLTGVYSEPTVERTYPAGSVAGNWWPRAAASSTTVSGRSPPSRWSWSSTLGARRISSCVGVTMARQYGRRRRWPGQG